MKPSRPTRFLAVAIAVISLLLTQLALASYVCPGMAVSGGSAMAGMAHCTGMDQDQPSLCQAHDHVGQQSLDKPDLPQLPPFDAAGPILTVVMPEAPALASTTFVALPFLAHATAPPLAIRHCCFRI